MRPELQKYIEVIEDALKAKLTSYESSIFYGPLLDALSGGKRLRPLLLLLSYESLNSLTSSRTDPLSAAVAIELLHTESLIHDDLIDHDSFRRGAPSLHAKYGEDMAILSADFVLSIISDLALEYEDARILRALAKAARQTCEGQMAELKLKARGSLMTEEYMRIVELKTGSLFEASAKIGALVAKVPQRQVDEFAAFGRQLGSAYQLYDDIRDGDELSSTLKIPGGGSLTVTSRQLVYGVKAKVESQLAQIQDTPPKKLLVMYVMELIHM